MERRSWKREGDKFKEETAELKKRSKYNFQGQQVEGGTWMVML